MYIHIYTGLVLPIGIVRPITIVINSIVIIILFWLSPLIPGT